jgi:hypothetical protein
MRFANPHPPPKDIDDPKRYEAERLMFLELTQGLLRPVPFTQFC